ncbi:MAG: hypothetical protein NXI16_01405 [Alphaproteobacteria bacterium]|nr:hypothetical protein [Alphaproteobacteria bacterium]
MTDLLGHIKAGGAVKHANGTPIETAAAFPNAVDYQIIALTDGETTPRMYPADGMSGRGAGWNIVPAVKVERRVWWITKTVGPAFKVPAFEDQQDAVQHCHGLNMNFSTEMPKVREVLPGDIDPDAALDLCNAVKDLVLGKAVLTDADRSSIRILVERAEGGK